MVINIEVQKKKVGQDSKV